MLSHFRICQNRCEFTLNWYICPKSYWWAAKRILLSVMIFVTIFPSGLTVLIGSQAFVCKEAFATRRIL